MALNLAQGKTDIRTFNGSDLLTPIFSSPYLKNQKLGEDAGRAVKPNPTKHQAATRQIKNSTQYKHKIDPLPPSPKPNLPVNDHWHEELIHGSAQGQELLDKIYAPFTIENLDTTTHKMKRKAPGNDQIYIDQFKYLGHRGKDLMLEIANKIWEKGQSLKEITMIPILKKDKPANFLPPYISPASWN